MDTLRAAPIKTCYWRKPFDVVIWPESKVFSLLPNFTSRIFQDEKLFLWEVKYCFYGKAKHEQGFSTLPQVLAKEVSLQSRSTFKHISNMHQPKFRFVVYFKHCGTKHKFFFILSERLSMSTAYSNIFQWSTRSAVPEESFLFFHAFPVLESSLRPKPWLKV